MTPTSVISKLAYSYCIHLHMCERTMHLYRTEMMMMMFTTWKKKKKKKKNGHILRPLNVTLYLWSLHQWPFQNLLNCCISVIHIHTQSVRVRVRVRVVRTYYTHVPYCALLCCAYHRTICTLRPITVTSFSWLPHPWRLDPHIRETYSHPYFHVRTYYAHIPYCTVHVPPYELCMYHRTICTLRPITVTSFSWTPYPQP
jgi:hypothetical protein